MLDEFTSSPHLYATMVNGTHIESLASAAIFNRYVVFLDLYVAHKAPDLAVAGFAWNLLVGSVTGASGVTLPPSGFEGLTYEQALAKLQAEPPVRVLFEEGAADGTPSGSPVPRYEADFARWPVPSAVATPWYLANGGTLADTTPTAAAGASGTVTSYVSNPSAVPATTYTGSSSGIWETAPAYDWESIPAADRASFLTAPLTHDTVIVGSSSVDLWLRSSAPDTDLEVTLSEVRPDGNEVYVQSGWLRASHRALDEAASTELRPVHTDLEADAAPLPSGELTPVRVELFPAAHAFRTGSRIRLTVHAPGGNRPTWAFATTVAKGETNEIAGDVDHPSRLVLPVVSGIAVPATAPACGALRGQPCRPYVAG